MIECIQISCAYEKWYVYEACWICQEEHEGRVSTLHSLVPQRFNMWRDYRGGLAKPLSAALSHAELRLSYNPGGHQYETHTTWWPLWELFGKV